MNMLLLILATAATGLLLQNCAQSPTEKAADSGPDPFVAQAKSDSESWAVLLPAYQLNREAAARERFTALNGASSEPGIELGKLPVFGTELVGSDGLKAKPRPVVVGMLLKSGARGQGLGGQALKDTTFYLREDSAKGFIRKVHAYSILEAGANVDAMDTLVFKFPHDSANASVLGHHGSRAYANGSLLKYAITDDDGDSVLNAAISPKFVRLQKRWITTHGDTTWKSLYYSNHGSTNYYDSIGAGSLSSWTDSVFVAGKLRFSQKVFDGDANPDGLLDSAKAGLKPKIKRDTYSDNLDGTFLYAYEIFGAGVDGKYASESDNERYAYQAMTVNAAGTLALTLHGDGDGDGFYFNPAATVNKAWIANAYTASDSVPEYRDSLEQLLSGTGGSVAKITHFSSRKKFKDGRLALTSTRRPDGAGFTGSDTVQVWERLLLADYSAKGAADPLAGLDSTLKVTWIVPGNPASPADDRILKMFSQVWNKAGQTAVTESKLFTPNAPLAANVAPTSGTVVIETRTNPTSSKSRIRSTLTQQFDAATKTSVWSRADHFENGDSAVSTGEGALAGAGTYVQDLGRYARNTGFHDAKSGEFRDTLILLDFKGGEKSREIASGTLDAAKGTGDYRVKRLGGKDTATAHIVITSDGNSGFILKRTSGSETVEIALRGDTAKTSKTFGGIRHTYAWVSAGGTYNVAQIDENVVTGASMATGNYYFGQDLSGNGTRTQTPAGKSPVESKVQFQSDGTVFVDGVRVDP